LAVPDGGQRDHGHIQTVKPRPAFDRAITDRAEEDRGDDGGQWVYESISQRHWDCGLRISGFGSRVFKTHPPRARKPDLKVYQNRNPDPPTPNPHPPLFTLRF